MTKERVIKSLEKDGWVVICCLKGGWMAKKLYRSEIAPTLNQLYKKIKG